MRQHRYTNTGDNDIRNIREKKKQFRVCDA